jgi:hypothetical protein
LCRLEAAVVAAESKNKNGKRMQKEEDDKEEEAGAPEAIEGRGGRIFQKGTFNSGRIGC